ncbi:DUF6455 family protein [Pseudorhodobacter sp.]|uniref:DUF6455 family protein n=1 Tax=Pseudorhodobacter sp. TaxID=1934400 RepID=UPI002648DF0E|nr:DUF6455 family protein [Pseudorhodobacter sp.]MDN5788013.1 DUF6455 family protein [Pseudorhodobacter sp.]
MFEKLKARLARKSLLEEVGTMPDRDLSDLGVSREQLANMVRIPDAVPDRMEKMADRFGADFTRLQRARDSYLDAVEECHHCGATKACGKALARSGADQATPEELDFCPNAELYRDLAQKPH